MQKVFLIFGVLVLISCSENSTDPVSKNTDQFISVPVDDFPNTPGTFWKYAWYDSLTATADTVLVSISQNFSAGDTTLWKYHFKTGIDSQFVVIKQDTVNIFEYLNYEYPRYVIVFPLKTGNAWTNRFYEDSVVAVENIQVLGKTKQAYIIREEWGILNDYGTIKSWFVPGIGIVKKNHTGYSFGTANNTWNLIEYSIKD